uniref:Uncharacterized protein n=1 Tax=Arundo donax TaxID=35708 RepID=A0A0A9BZC3_ARUDO
MRSERTHGCDQCVLGSMRPAFGEYDVIVRSNAHPWKKLSEVKHTSSKMLWFYHQ